jgi:2-succinyl-5-enolpyruvyl-6-hydroxy-3-cyclohexene-1-carboxylate synthase
MFSLKYHRPESWEALDAALSSAWRQPGATLIELVVNDADGAQKLQSLLAQVSHL